MLNITYHPEYALALISGSSLSSEAAPLIKGLVIDKLPGESLAVFSERANREALGWLGDLTSRLNVVVHGVSYDWSNSGNIS